MLSEAIPGAVDEGQERVRCHRFHEPRGVVPHRLRPQVWSFMHSLKKTLVGVRGARVGESAEDTEKTVKRKL